MTDTDGSGNTPLFNLGDSLCRLVDEYNHKLDNKITEIESNLKADKKQLTDAGITDPNEIQNLEDLAETQIRGLNQSKILILPEDISATTNYFIDAIFPVRKGEEAKITDSFLGRLGKVLESEQPEAFMAALKHLPELYRNLPTKDVEKWAKVAEKSKNWDVDTRADYYSLKSENSVPIRSAGKSRLVAGLVSLVVGTGAMAAINYTNIWNPSADECQVESAQMASGYAQRKSDLEKELSTCNQKSEQSNQDYAEVLKDKDQVLTEGNKAYFSCLTDLEKTGSARQEFENLAAEYKTQLDDCLKTASVLAPLPVVPAEPVVPAQPVVPSVPTPVPVVPETPVQPTVNVGYTLQNIADYIGSQPGKRVVVDGSNCGTALTNLYLKMGGDKSDKTSIDTFVADYASLCGNVNPHSGSVVFRVK